MLTYKIIAVKILLYRAYHILSNYLNFHNELEYLKSYFINNGHLSAILHKITNEFLSKMYSKESKLNFDVRKLTTF